jgi:hypothetical protein
MVSTGNDTPVVDFSDSPTDSPISLLTFIGVAPIYGGALERRVGDMSETTTKLADWLSSLEHISAITPMTVAINGKTYDACSYAARFETPEGSEAYRRGERHYWRNFIYCVGELPKCYQHNTRVVFTIDGDPADWYVASYWPQLHNHRQQASETRGKYQPFGANFLLAPWDAKQPIDHYEDRPRRRYAATVA